jgi:hypothetical protein
MTEEPQETPVAPPAATSVTANAERRMVAGAYRKVMAHKQLTASERAALKRHEKEQEERLRWQYYGSIPQKHWREMSGRQAKVLNEQAERYGLPFGGATINLTALARALHNFLAQNALKLANEDDALLGGGSSPALEEYRKKRAALADLDLLERQNQLIPRDQARQAMGRVAGILRNAQEALQRQFGPAAMDIISEALDEADQEVDRCFGQVQATEGSNADANSAKPAAQ